MDSFAVAVVATWVAVFCAGAALYALARDRNAAAWALFGGILGPIAIALLALAPPTRCPECGAPNSGWQPICAACRAAGGPAIPAAAGHGSEPASPAAAPPLQAPWSPPSTLTWAEPEAQPAPVRIPSVASYQADDEGPVRMLATAVYSGGTQPLTIGHRYILAIRGDDLEVRGPVDRDPNAAVFVRPLLTLGSVGMGDRLAISSTQASRQGVSMAFINLIGDTGENLERVLEAGRARPAETDGRER